MSNKNKQLFLHKKIAKYLILRKLGITNRKNFEKKLTNLSEQLFEELYREKQKAKWKEPNPQGVLNRKRIIILTSKHTDFIAKQIAFVFESYNFEAPIIYDYDASIHHDSQNLYLVICPNIFTKGLPEHYFAYNFEQTISERWFTEDYIKKLDEAISVLDYSLTNIDYLEKNNIAPKRVFYAPIAPTPAPDSNFSKRTTDILFYGDNHSPRRQAILEKLSKRFNIKIVNNLFHEDMLRELDDAKIVLNIHYYEGAMLETPRLCEAISRGCLVVSESSINDVEYPELQAMVDFAKVDDINDLEKKLNYWLSHPEKLQEKMAKNRSLAQDCFKKFSYHIARVLMNHDLVSFESFYRNEKDFFSLGDGRICIGLPESIQRQKYFKSVNSYAFRMFPAIKHQQGWIGAALSYKFLARKAVEEERSQLIICEDDVVFPADFAERANEAELYFNSQAPHVFSGFIVDLHPDAKILDITQSKNQVVVTTDKLVSMVYGIYSNYILNVIANWDNTNRDINTNTIDRYLESKENIKVAFTIPFLVGHNGDMSSTLWGGKNDNLYNQLLEDSLRRIKDKIKKYQKDAN